MKTYSNGLSLGTGDGVKTTFSVAQPGQKVTAANVVAVWRLDANGNTQLYKNSLQLAAGRYPQFAFNYAVDARASVATYLDSAGILQTAAANTPRVDVDSAGVKSLLVEDASVNYVLNSETSGIWVNNTPNTPISGAILGLNGTLLISGSVGGDAPNFRAALPGGPVAAGVPMVCSVHVDLATAVATGGVTNFTLLQSNSSGSSLVNARLTLGTQSFQVLSQTGVVLTSYGCDIRRVFGTIYQLSVWVVSPLATTALRLYPFAPGGNQVVAGVAQIEFGRTTPSSYIPTGAIIGTRAADQVTLADYAYDQAGNVTLAAAPVNGTQLTWFGDYDYVTMPTTDSYVDLITSEHRDKPLFVAMVRALCQAFVDIGNAAIAMPPKFDLDVAVGDQLDAVGAWVGISRFLPVPLTGVYFSWDSTALLGWDSGSWQGPFDPDTGLVSLPDDQYRILIRAKIAANRWDGTIAGAEAIWDIIFGGVQTIIIQDNQDMSMTVGFVGPPLSAVQQALLLKGIFPLKPGAVRIRYYAVPVDTGPLFAWDANSPSLQGWDTGRWPQEINPS